LALPSIYRSADCLVFPTLEDAWGLVVNEAIWAGLPVAASIYAGCTAEIVPPGNRFDPLDPRQFLDILRRAVDGDLARTDMTVMKTGRDVAGMIIRDIDEVLEKRAGPRLP
jgi:glycosyltransferase involved in cell wall biosynthesis